MAWDSDCQTELNPDLLVRDERYEARVRILASDSGYESTWSDWSPTASWVAPIGTTKAPSMGNTAVYVGLPNVI